MSAADIHRHVTEVYGNEAMIDSNDRKWAKKFKDGFGEKRFSDNKEMKADVNSWLSDQSVDFFEEGFQIVLSRIGRNQTTIMRICDRWMHEGTTDRRVRSYPPQLTTSREDRQIGSSSITRLNCFPGRLALRILCP
ncbi:hypothetical protein TNCV_1566661 [Trichonephila clavipes]|nr:hypothetical protein TNCV_1566661 [Trichonephila clavipes]